MRIGSDNLGGHLLVIVQINRYFGSPFHHVVVGDDVPVFRNNYPRSESDLFAGLHISFPETEEEIKRIHILLLGNGLNLNVDNSIDRPGCGFCKIGITLLRG
ncbi:hypothetical protein SDC9_127665 [bioreactor metagenome]|uniref:Uncharacterized protein n=1 Tax=bioreactor metagenome TaxID=1076179 RepID=A0A645CUQ4_9ZZZZ